MNSGAQPTGDQSEPVHALQPPSRCLSTSSCGTRAAWPHCSQSITSSSLLQSPLCPLCVLRASAHALRSLLLSPAQPCCSVESAAAAAAACSPLPLTAALDSSPCPAAAQPPCPRRRPPP